MLIIATGIRPVTSLFLIILTTKTRRAPVSACQVTATACSIVGRPPRIPDANRDRQCALGRGDQARMRRAQARAFHRRPGNRGFCGAHGQEQPAGRGGPPFARHDPQARGRTRSRQRGLSPRGAAEGALAALFSRYEKNMHYGSHVDDALMDGMRTDVSFTLFLSEPTSYDGGELTIESAAGEET